MARPAKFSEQERAMLLKRIEDLQKKVQDELAHRAEEDKKLESWKEGYRAAVVDMVEVYAQ